MMAAIFRTLAIPSAAPYETIPLKISLNCEYFASWIYLTPYLFLYPTHSGFSTIRYLRDYVEKPGIYDLINKYYAESLIRDPTIKTLPFSGQEFVILLSKFELGASPEWLVHSSICILQ
jgi:hypothetical protein